MKKTLLITGGAGYIGSYVAYQLERLGYQIVVLDDLSRGVKEAVKGTLVIGDVGDQKLLESLFSSYSFDAVFHFAGSISVGESFIQTAAYYQNNVVKSLSLLNAMVKHEVKRFVFSSSAGVYGVPSGEYVRESDPLIPINPYGNTKLMVEMALKDYAQRYGMQYAALRYFNAAGGDPEGKFIHYPRKECNLIPIILSGLLRLPFEFQLNGMHFNTPDGTCIRDYVHVDDLYRAHLLAYEYLKENKNNLTLNLGNGEGYSNLEVIKCCEEVTGLKVSYKVGEARLGDAPKLVADAKLAKEILGWGPRYCSLKEMVKHAWRAMNIVK